MVSDPVEACGETMPAQSLWGVFRVQGLQMYGEQQSDLVCGCPGILLVSLLFYFSSNEALLPQGIMHTVSSDG